jgi:AcrR family transcriptional regulator
MKEDQHSPPRGASAARALSSEKQPLGRQALKTRQTREKIINAVISLIKEGGFGAASSTRIAERAGITWGAAQHHFGSKEEILDAVIEMSNERFTARLKDQRLRSGSIADRCDLLVELMWQHYQEDLYLAALEILLAVRGFGSQKPAPWEQRVTRRHVKTMREIFHESSLDDARLIEALAYVHCFLTGLTIERAFESKIKNVSRHLQRTKMALMIMVTDM